MPMVLARGWGRLVSSLAGIALAGLLAATPAAHAQLTPILPVGSGLTMPAGVADAGGDIWISDSVLGVCRVDPALGTVVQDGTWCGAAHTGPVAPSQLAYDPASGWRFVAERAARQAANVRRGTYLVGISLTNGADHYGPTRFRRLYVVR